MLSSQVDQTSVTPQNSCVGAMVGPHSSHAQRGPELARSPEWVFPSDSVELVLPALWALEVALYSTQLEPPGAGERKFPSQHASQMANSHAETGEGDVMSLLPTPHRLSFACQ